MSASPRSYLGQKCGVGFQLKTRNCVGRTFGGALCKIGENVRHDSIHPKNFKCDGPPCPGIKIDF